MKQSDNRSIQVIWCDDIRQEVGNKPSFMGVYTGQLVMPSLPATLHRLCAYIQLATPLEQPFDKLEIKIVRNDTSEFLASMTIPDADVAASCQAIVQANEKVPDDDKMVAVGFGLMAVIGPIEVTEQTRWLKVFADTGNEVLESLKLRIVFPALDGSTP